MSTSSMVPAPTGLASLCVETLLYGAFVVLFAFSMCLMTNMASSVRGKQCPYPKPILFFSILLCFLVTTHWVLSVVRAFQAFILHLDGQAAAEFFADLSQFSSVLRQGVLMGLLMTSDLTIIYRLWLVWNQKKGVVIIPIMLLFALSAFAVISVYKFVVPDVNPLHNHTPGDIIITGSSFWVIGLSMTSFSINLYSAGMIIYKLCRASKATRDSESVSWFKFIIIILVESLSLYTIWGALYAIFYSLKSQISLLFLDTESPIVGIAFITLHVRVGMRRLGHDATISIEGQSNREKKIARPEFEGH